MTATGTEARVCEMIAARQLKGLAKYGTTVSANPLTLRQWLQHALEESLDQSVYLARAIEQIDREQVALSHKVADWQTTYGGACP
jgi:hypothetical protein